MTDPETIAEVQAQLRLWREQLVDLSRPNRLVNLSRTKTSTVGITAPSFSAVLDGLATSDGWRFHYPPPEPGEGDSVSLAALPAEDPDLDDVHHPDELITDASSADRLSLTLRNLERRATQKRMDRGLNVLYLTVGLLEWTDIAGDQVNGPPLMVPVEFGRASPRHRFACAAPATILSPTPPLRSSCRRSRISNSRASSSMPRTRPLARPGETRCRRHIARAASISLFSSTCMSNCWFTRVTFDRSEAGLRQTWERLEFVQCARATSRSVSTVRPFRTTRSRGCRWHARAVGAVRLYALSGQNAQPQQEGSARETTVLPRRLPRSSPRRVVRSGLVERPAK